MRVRMSRKVGLAVLLSVATVFYAARAAAFFDVGGDVMLAEILANTTKQLTVMTQSLAELRKSYGEVKRVAAYADDAAAAARSFRSFSARASASGSRRTSTPRIRTWSGSAREALAASGMGASPWAQGTGTLQQLSSYCLADAAAGRPVCVQLRGELENANAPPARSQRRSPRRTRERRRRRSTRRSRRRSAPPRPRRARATSRRRASASSCASCNGASEFGDAHEAARFAEECQLAAQQAQVLHLEEGQETNVRLAEIARLQALAVEQKNADLKRELAERAGQRAALTAGLETLVGERVTIRTGGVQP